MRIFLLTLILMSGTVHAIAQNQAASAPRNLSATAGNGETTLDWDAPTNKGNGDFIRYEYSLVISGNNDQWFSATLDEDTTTVTVNAGVNGTTYTCKVRMITAVGFDELEGAAASTTVTPTLAAPQNFTATAGDGQVLLQWDSVTDASRGYQYRQGTGNWTPSQTPFITTTSKTITGLTNGTSYTFAVKGINNGGGGSSSDAVTATPTIPAPTNFTATAGDGEVTLNWTAPSVSTITGYEYQKDSDAWASAGTSSSYIVTGLANGQAYAFKVRAVGSGGSGTASSPASATPMITVVAPGAPTGLTATLGDGQIILSWTAPSGPITGYQYSQNGGAWTSTGWTPATGTNTTRTVTNLTNGTPYTFKVRAVNSAGDGAESGSASATPDASAPPPPPPPPPSQPSQTVPGPPENLQVQTVADTATNTAKAILTWSPPNNAENAGQTIGYAYRYKSSPWTPWKSTGSSSTTYTVTGLENGKAYTFEIGAYYVDLGMATLSASNPPTAAVMSDPKSQRQILLRPRECPLGWTRGSVFGNTQKALIYELKVEADPTNTTSIYQLKSIAIYVHPDENLETLHGWTLKVGTLYNQFGKEFKLTTENSVIDEHDFAHIENPEETPIPMGMLGYIGQSLPSFDYRLYDGAGVRVDFGISCYKGGGLTWRLWNTADPRLLRVLPLGASEEALSVQMENLDWRTPFFRSEWTAAIMPDLPDAPAAPSQMKGNIVGTWGDLKKQ